MECEKRVAAPRLEFLREEGEESHIARTTHYNFDKQATHGCVAAVARHLHTADIPTPASPTNPLLWQRPTPRAAQDERDVPSPPSPYSFHTHPSSPFGFQGLG